MPSYTKSDSLVAIEPSSLKVFLTTKPSWSTCVATTFLPVFLSYSIVKFAFLFVIVTTPSASDFTKSGYSSTKLLTSESFLGISTLCFAPSETSLPSPATGWLDSESSSD